jgi:addiction module RelE/StbE family toxin
MKPRWTLLARERVLEIRAEIAKDNEGAAARTIGRIRASVKRLEAHPHIGRPGKTAGTRELVVPGTPYIIPYQVLQDRIEILSVVHGKQQWPQNFQRFTK